MNVEVLIDAIVRQTTVLLAQLATAAGARTPMAHTANQVFVDLTRELRTQGMTHAVIADMFGLALRTYHKKIQRLSESATFRGQSLWTAVFKHIQDHGPMLRAEVLQRFRNDDEATLRGVLSDMVEAGALYTSGSGDATAFRVVAVDELPRASSPPEQLVPMVWVAVYRYGPTTLEGLTSILPAPADAITHALCVLLDDGRVRESESATANDGEDPVYTCTHCFIPVGAEQGWEAAVFDHYQAVVTGICRKLQLRSGTKPHSETTGGTTYRFTVWPGHPEYEHVTGLLARLRGEISALRERVELYNQTHDAPTERDYQQYIAYVGQTRLADDTDVTNI